MHHVDVDRLVAQLEPEVAAGRLVLFTGAGFGSDARTVSGHPLPTSDDLCELLWPVAFPGQERDDSRLDDIYGCAVAEDEAGTRDALRRRFRVDGDSLPDGYRRWYSVPWSRAYTLNIDDLDEAVARRWELPAPIRSVSALAGRLPDRADGLLSIHLNGRIADFPRLTFSPLEYGHRTAVPDPWYQHLAADLAERPIVFVGTSLDEPPLWQQLALHLDGAGSAPGNRRERSYLVIPHASRARVQVLRRLDVEWVPMDAAAFADQVLVRLQDAGADGHRALVAGSADSAAAPPPPT